MKTHEHGFMKALKRARQVLCASLAFVALLSARAEDGDLPISKNDIIKALQDKNTGDQEKAAKAFKEIKNQTDAQSKIEAVINAVLKEKNGNAAQKIEVLDSEFTERGMFSLTFKVGLQKITIQVPAQKGDTLEPGFFKLGDDDLQRIKIAAAAKSDNSSFRAQVKPAAKPASKYVEESDPTSAKRSADQKYISIGGGQAETAAQTKARLDGLAREKGYQNSNDGHFQEYMNGHGP